MAIDNNDLYPVRWDRRKGLWITTVDRVTITHPKIDGLHDRVAETFGEDAVGLVFQVGDPDGFEQFVKEKIEPREDHSDDPGESSLS